MGLGRLHSWVYGPQSPAAPAWHGPLGVGPPVGLLGEQENSERPLSTALCQACWSLPSRAFQKHRL